MPESTLLSFDDFEDEIKEEPKPSKKTEKTKQAAKTIEPKKETKTVTKKTDVTSWTYPFSIHYAGHMLDITGMFEEGQSYTDKQITDILLSHRYYEFSGDVSYVYFEADNVLVPSFKQHKKG